MAKINIEITSYIEDDLVLRPAEELHARTVGKLVDDYIVDIIKDDGIPTKVAVTLTPEDVQLIRRELDIGDMPTNRKANDSFDLSLASIFKATTKRPRI